MLGGSGLPPLDLSVLLQFAITALALVSGLLFVVRSAASRYFVVDARFESDIGGFVGRDKMSDGEDKCFVCDRRETKKCSRCKGVRYCSQECQSKHWKGGHNRICKEPKVFDDSLLGGTFGRTKSSSIALVPSRGSCKVLGLPKKVLFPYDEFVKLFNWDKHIYPPCGLLNCGNSCFANVILQCLACTRPLVAYLLEGSHFKTCGRNDWCFLCELRNHIQNVSQSMKPFSPMNILDRLPKIGGNLGHGRQEDAHEFMRLAIDTMQSVCLDEFGGEKALDPSIQETTLIQHIFGGHLQSQVKCTKCDKISNRYENMMDLTVEIQGDAESLEECLNQFTGKEWLDGENMYKCEGCDEYVKAWKRLTVHQPPNVLTVALKRFQSGRFGKLNKRVTFPVTLDLVPYMSEARDNTDLYELYAVVVHIDMLNASFFGHYICYTKDFHGNWYRVDDCKVTKVDVEEVLAQGAYMLLYSRKSARQPHIREPESSKIKDVQSAETDPCNMVSANSMEHELERETVRIRADTASDLHVPNNIKGDIGVEESGDVDKSSFINTDVDKPLETDEDQFLKKDLVESEDSCSSGPTKDGLECSAAKYLDGGLPEGNILFQEEFGTKAVNLLTSVDDRFPKENVGSTSMPEETFKDGIIGTSFCPSTAALDGVPELKESDPAGPSREHTDPVDDSSDPGTAVIDLQDNTFSSGSTSNGEVKQHSSDCFLEQEPAVGEATSTGNGAGHSRLYSCNRLGSGDLNSGEDLQRNGSPDENAQMKSQVTGAGETTRRTEVKSTSAGIPAGDGNCNGVLHGPENLSAEDGWRRPSSSAFLSYEAQKLVLNGGAETDSSKVCSPCKMPADRNEKAPMGNGQVDFRDHSRPSREQEKSRSRGRRKPLFPRGFLDQHAEARTVEGKSQKEGAIPQMGNGDRTATSCSTQSTLQNGEKYDPIRSPLPENGIGMVLCSADVPLVSNGGFPSKSSEKTLKNAAKSQNGYAIPSKSSCNGG